MLAKLSTLVEYGVVKLKSHFNAAAGGFIVLDLRFIVFQLQSKPLDVLGSVTVGTYRY